jgi:aminoglycoside phosphotransferase (APT) family kinase protein
VLGSSRLEVFIYPDEAALLRDVSNIDTLAAAPPGTRGPWETTPTFVRSGNLAAVFLTESQQQAERLTLALTAGAPQP